MTIRRLWAWEILDSRGNPTVAAACELSSGVVAQAHAPSGASTGRHEAVELRDGDPTWYAGKGVRQAVAHINGEIQAALAGQSISDQAALDQQLLALDGTPQKSRLGANAMLAVSCTLARARSVAENRPLWQSLAGERTACLPLPMVNIFSGGLHAGRNIEFQDFLVVPHGIVGYPEQLAAVVAVHRAAGTLLRERGYELTGVADEGGWGPRLASNELALALLTEAIARAGYQPGEHFSLALDVAASHFWNGRHYVLATEDRELDSAGMIDLLADWCGRFPVCSIEDGLQEDDWEGWAALTARLGGRVQLVGDDLFTTRRERVEQGIQLHAANAVLVKMNQIGTLTETFEVIDLARAAGFRAVVSARSGETEDSFLADLAIASGAGQIKIGSITRSERLAKYNRLLEVAATTPSLPAAANLFSGFKKE